MLWEALRGNGGGAGNAASGAAGGAGGQGAGGGIAVTGGQRQPDFRRLAE